MVREQRLRVSLKQIFLIIFSKHNPSHTITLPLYVLHYTSTNPIQSSKKIVKQCKFKIVNLTIKCKKSILDFVKFYQL